MAIKFLRNKKSKEVIALDTAADASELARKTTDHWIGTPADVQVKKSAEPAEYEDVTPSGGGSAFAHLEEDGATSSVLATDGWQFGVGDVDFSGACAFLSVPSAAAPAFSSWSTDPTHKAIEIGQFDGAAPALQVLSDGSLHWGDGTAAPDTPLTRLGPGLLVLGDPTETAGSVHFGGTPGGDQGLYMQGATDFIDSSCDLGYIAIGKPGSYLQLHSPDGTGYDVSVANGGTIAIAAA